MHKNEETDIKDLNDLQQESSAENSEDEIAGEKMELDFKKDNEIGIIKISGRLVVSNAREFRDTINKYIEQSRFLVLDLTDMEYIDSLGLGSLINFYKTVTENDGDLYIAGLQSKPKTLFQITKAYLIFSIFDTLDEAVASLQQKINLAVSGK